MVAFGFFGTASRNDLPRISSWPSLYKISIRRLVAASPTSSSLSNGVEMGSAV